MASKRKKKREDPNKLRTGKNGPAFREGQRVAREALDAKLSLLEAQVAIDQLALNAFIRWNDATESITSASTLVSMFQEAKLLAKQAVSDAGSSGAIEWLKRMKDLTMAVESLLTSRMKKAKAAVIKEKIDAIELAFRQVQPSS